jgi:hypothetical protein
MSVGPDSLADAKADRLGGSDRRPIGFLARVVSPALAGHGSRYRAPATLSMERAVLIHSFQNRRMVVSGVVRGCLASLR